MKRLTHNWLARLLFFIGGILSLRLISTLLHMTTLEKLYKPRDFRKTSHLELSDKIVASLPQYCQNIFGQKMDPINLVFVGTDAGIRRAFEKAGWDGAHPSSPIHVGLGFASSIINKTYRKGPFMPLFISIGLQDMAFQKITDGYSQRHHIRIWRTRHALPRENRVWVAAATYEKSFRLGRRFPFIFHRLDPNLDWERDYIAGELVAGGNRSGDSIRINTAIKESAPEHNPHGDPYFTDGKARVIEIV